MLPLIASSPSLILPSFLSSSTFSLTLISFSTFFIILLRLSPSVISYPVICLRVSTILLFSLAKLLLISSDLAKSRATSWNVLIISLRLSVETCCPAACALSRTLLTIAIASSSFLSLKSLAILSLSNSPVNPLVPNQCQSPDLILSSTVAHRFLIACP